MATRKASPRGHYATLPAGGDGRATWPEPPKLHLLDSVRQAASRSLAGLLFLLAIASAGPPIDAQSATRIPKIAYLAAGTQVTIGHLIAAFRQGLQELGYVEGKTALLEVRLAEGVAERLPQLARELVALKSAKAIGLTIPPALLRRADHVIH